MKAKTREPPLKIPLAFDDAIKRGLSVKPPAEGWAKYEAKLKATRKKSPRKRSSAKAK